MACDHHICEQCLLFMETYNELFIEPFQCPIEEDFAVITCMKDVYLDQRLFKHIRKRELNIRKREEYEAEKLRNAELIEMKEIKEKRSVQTLNDILFKEIPKGHREYFPPEKVWHERLNGQTKIPPGSDFMVQELRQET